MRYGVYNTGIHIKYKKRSFPSLYIFVGRHTQTFPLGPLSLFGGPFFFLSTSPPHPLPLPSFLRFFFPLFLFILSNERNFVCRPELLLQLFKIYSRLEQTNGRLSSLMQMKRKSSKFVSGQRGILVVSCPRIQLETEYIF